MTDEKIRPYLRVATSNIWVLSKER